MEKHVEKYDSSALYIEVRLSQALEYRRKTLDISRKFRKSENILENPKQKSKIHKI